MINIIDLEKESMTDFERKYMFTEAPDDQERVNVKRIRLKAPDRRTYDFKKGAGGDDETTETPDNTEELDDTDTSSDTVEENLVIETDPKKNSSVKKGALIRLEPTNIAYVKPHEVLVNNIKFLFFNNTDFFCINDLDNRYKLSDLEEILKLIK